MSPKWCFNGIWVHYTTYNFITSYGRKWIYNISKSQKWGEAMCWSDLNYIWWGISQPLGQILTKLKVQLFGIAIKYEVPPNVWDTYLKLNSECSLGLNQPIIWYGFIFIVNCIWFLPMWFQALSSLLMVSQFLDKDGWECLGNLDYKLSSKRIRIKVLIFEVDKYTIISKPLFNIVSIRFGLWPILFVI